MLEPRRVHLRVLLRLDRVGLLLPLGHRHGVRCVRGLIPRRILLLETYKFLIKMNDLHEVQKAMIRFVKGLGDIYPHDLKRAFEDLYNELKQYENDPYERRSFLYLDILSWLESKINNVPITQVIKNKATQLNRKERPSISPLSADLK